MDPTDVMKALVNSLNNPGSIVTANAAADALIMADDDTFEKVFPLFALLKGGAPADVEFAVRTLRSEYRRDPGILATLRESIAEEVEKLEAEEKGA